MLRQTFRWNWPITLYMQVVFFYCMIYSFAQYTITTQPMHAAVTEGETASITCEWEPDLLPGYNLRWSFFKGSDVRPVEESSDTKYILLSKSNSSTLLIPSFNGSDAGGYRCEIIPVVYSSVARVSMLTCTPKTDEGQLGSILKCSSTLDTINLQWFRNGEPLDETKHKLISTMTLSRKDYDVEFTCRATYDRLEIGNCTTTPLILTIDARIEKTPPGSIQVGDKFNLTCLVNGDPDKYEYRWMFESRIEDASMKKCYKFGDQYNVLAFSDVISVYNGRYISCTVSRLNRISTVAFFIIELSNLTIGLPTTPSDNIDATKSSSLLSIFAITLAIFISISMIIFTVIYHKKMRIIGLNMRNASNRRLDNIDNEYDDVALPRKRSTEIATGDSGEPHTSLYEQVH